MKRRAAIIVFLAALLPLPVLKPASLSGNIFASGTSFGKYLYSIDYPEVKQSLTGREVNEFSRINIYGNQTVYPDRVIKLYLLASGITEEKEWDRYLERFTDLVDGAMESINSNSYLRKLNTYNKTEYLLHYLHDNLFKIELKGASSGYNIGIRSSFDEGKFNCYKSSLIYNAFLEYFNINAFYMSVPNHIYSAFRVNGKIIDVETTNKYGFDPWDRGLPQYRRAFDRKNVQFQRTTYRSKQPMDNLRVLVQVYNNRSILYAGEMTYPGIDASRDLHRAAALSLLGDFLSNGRDEYIIHNTLYKLFMVTNENLEKNPFLLDKEYRRYDQVLQNSRYSKYAVRHYRNLEIATSRSLAQIRDARLKRVNGDPVEGSLEILARECENANKYITRNSSIRFTVCNNAMVRYSNILERELPQDNLGNIMRYSRQILKMFSLDVMERDARIQQIKPRFVRMISARINNLGADAMNNGEWRTADSIFTRGIRFLQHEIKEYDRTIMNSMLQNHRTVKKKLNGD